MRVIKENFSKFLAIGVCIIVALTLGFKLLTQYFIDEIRENPKNDLQNNLFVHWLINNSYNNQVTYPQTPLSLTEVHGIKSQYPDINLLEGANVKWDIQIIHIFSSWCVNCYKELEALEQIKKLLKQSNISKRILFTGLVYDSNYTDVMEMLHDYTTIYDRLGNINEEEGVNLGIAMLPLTLIVDKNGIIIYRNSKALTISDAKDIKTLYEQAIKP